MHIELKLQQTELLAQESTTGVVVFSNDSSQPVTFPDPEFSSLGVVLRLKDLSTGKSSDYSVISQAKACDPQYVPSFLPPQMRTLSPGQSAGLHIDLLSWVGTLRPGSYSLRAVVEADPVFAQSAPVQITVGSAPNTWVRAQPPSSDLVPTWYSAWATQDKAGGFLILIHGVQLGTYVSPTGTLRVGRTQGPVQPVLSAPPNGAFVQGHWVTWLDGSKLMYAYGVVEGGRVIYPPKAFDLGAQDLYLLEPALTSVAADQLPGSGYVMLLQEGTSGKNGRMLGVTLDPDGSAHGVVLGNVPEADSVWNQVTYLSNQVRRAFWITARGTETRLHGLTWPAATNQPATLESPMTRWSGRYIAAAAGLDDSDVLHGRTLIWSGGSPEKGPAVEAVAWRVNGDGQFQEGAGSPLDWPADRQILDWRMRLTKTGEAYGILKDGDGQWHLFDPDGKVSPIAVSVAAQDVDILFTSANQPVVRHSYEYGGFQYVFPDGRGFKTW